MAMIRVADYVMKRLAEIGMAHIFYVPGGQCVYLMDALRRNRDIDGVAMHHEQAAAMAALSYALYNNQMGACLVSTGCAGTNTMTGVLHAWQDSIPCIFISGQQNKENTLLYNQSKLRQIGVQEANIVELVSPITKYAVMLTEPMEIAYQIDKALTMAMSGRKGPVWLDIPLDIQNAMVNEEKLERYVAETETAYQIEQEMKEKLTQMIGQAQRPVIFAGAGVRSSNAIEELKAFAELNEIPIVLTRYSVDMLTTDYEYNYGVVCSVGASRYANFMIQNSDLVIDIGCRMSMDTIGSDAQSFAREAKIIMVDIDVEELNKNGVVIDCPVLSDAKWFLTELTGMGKLSADTGTWIETCKHWKEIFSLEHEPVLTSGLVDLKRFHAYLSSKLPEGSVMLSDAGFTGAAASSTCMIKRNTRLLHAYAQGEMGYSLPGAVGAACAARTTTVALCGDGSVMMNLQELQTVARNDFNIKIIIYNNNGYSGVRHGQKAHFRGKTIGTDPSNGLDFPDFEKLAAAFGLSYVRVTDIQDKRLEQLLANEKPCICEVICDPDQSDLHNALVKYEKNGKTAFGFRPIEDQAPFIERGVFFSEMIVKPLDTSNGTPV